MRRLSKSSSRRLTADSQRLIAYGEAMLQASSRLEERAWEGLLDGVLHKLLKGNGQDSIDAALEQSYKNRPPVYDVLMETIEANSETIAFEHEGTEWHGLLLAAPILAWTRFSIASGAIHGDMLQTLSAHLYAHVLA